MGSTTFRVLALTSILALIPACRASMNMKPPPDGASVPAVPTTLSQSQSQGVNDKFSAHGETA